MNGSSRFARLSRFSIAVCLLAVLALVARLGGQTRTFLWKATRGQGVVYLVGSVHSLSADYYPLSPVLDAAFKDSDLLVEEVDLGEVEAPASQMQLLTRGMLPAGQSLDKVLSPG